MDFLMYELLPHILNMSITGSIVIAVILIFRVIFRKIPKIYTYILWSVVLFRLLCPISFESNVSMMDSFNAPSSDQGYIEYIPHDIVFTSYPSVQIPIGSDVVNSNLPQGDEQEVADPLEAPIVIATLIWIIGLLSILVFSVVQFVNLKRKLAFATHFQDNIYIDNSITSPFVIGIIKPKIYLPSQMQADEFDYIIAHERQHIKRFDHITRILSFIALAIHWFNPLVWVAFVVSAKDMEMSCDEAVMHKMESDIRVKYSTSLLKFATGRKILSATPLAFGESDTKSRVKNILKYKKPAFWVSTICLVLVSAVAVCLVSNAKEKLTEPPTIYAYYENGIVQMKLGAYTWINKGLFTSTGTSSSSIHYANMNYTDKISFNDNKGHKNANIILSLDNQLNGWNSDNIKWDNNYKITGMKRYVNGQEEVLDEFDTNFILVSLETDDTYFYEFKIEFDDGKSANYSLQIDNNVLIADDEPIADNEPIDEIASNIDVDESITASSSVIDMAKLYLQDVTYAYNELGVENDFEITGAKITGLDKINNDMPTDDDVSVNLYKLEYRLSVDNIDNVPLIDGMSIENEKVTEWSSSGQLCMLFYDDYLDDLDEIFIEYKYTRAITSLFGADEYLEKYATAFTAYAYETYAQYIPLVTSSYEITKVTDDVTTTLEKSDEINEFASDLVFSALVQSAAWQTEADFNNLSEYYVITQTLYDESAQKMEKHTFYVYEMQMEMTSGYKLTPVVDNGMYTVLSDITYNELCNLFE